MRRTLRNLALLSVLMVLILEGCKEGSNTIAGHEYVDLGLPSGLKWATCNVGAATPEEYGNYYAWGKTMPRIKDPYEYMSKSYLNVGDISGNATYDAARANWGATWRMPTIDEMEELAVKCTWTWSTQSCTNGYTVTGPNGNSIFLPAAGFYFGASQDDVDERGYYWSSNPYDNIKEYACLYFGFDGKNKRLGIGGRSFGGLTIRPVSD